MTNGANEQAVALFLQEKISFLQIGRLVEEVQSRFTSPERYTVDDVLQADAWARRQVLSLLS